MKSLLPFYLFLPSLIHAYYVDFDVDWTFQEELPKNTELVGHYKIEEKDDTTGMWRLASPSIQLAAVISEVVGDKKHKVQSFSGPPQGAFIYNAMEAGEHEIHLKPDVGYFASTKKLRLHLKYETKDEDIYDPADVTHNELASNVKDLNTKTLELRRELAYQRQREHTFRDKSEAVNSGVVWWSISIMIFGAILHRWTNRHLKSFFEQKKLV